MKNSETNNKPDFDSPNWSTREELERLIELAPTAIRRQALQQKLTAMKEADKDDIDISAKQDSDTVEKSDVPVKKTETLMRQDDAIVEEIDVFLDQDGGMVEKSDISVEEADAIVEKAETLMRQDDAIVEEIDVLVEQDGGMVEKSDISVEEADAIVEKAETLMRQDDAIVEAVDVLVEQDGGMVEKSQASVEEADAIVEKAETLIKQDDVRIEEPELSVRQDGVILEKVGASVEEGAVLKQGKQADNFYVHMRRKPNFSPVKTVLLSVAVLLISISSILLIRRDMPVESEVSAYGMAESKIQGDTDDTMGQMETFADSVSSLLVQIKKMVWGESTESPSSSKDYMVSTETETWDAVFDMYEAKGMALDFLLKFDEFIEMNGVPRSQQETDIKNQLQSAQIQQQYGQYDKAAAIYRQVSSELESLMSVTQQLIAKKHAAELARLHWESYRWHFYRDAHSLSFTSEESALIGSAIEVDKMMIQNEQEDHSVIVEKALTRYKNIEHGYIRLLDGVREVVKARTSVEPIRQRWHQFRDQHSLDGKAITGIEQDYRRAIELEAAGGFQEAIKSYELASNRYTKALEDGPSMVAKQNQ